MGPPGDEHDLGDPGQDEGFDRVADHGPVVDREKVLVGDPGQGVKASARPSSQDDALHRCFSSVTALAPQKSAGRIPGPKGPYSSSSAAGVLSPVEPSPTRATATSRRSVMAATGCSLSAAPDHAASIIRRSASAVSARACRSSCSRRSASSARATDAVCSRRRSSAAARASASARASAISRWRCSAAVCVTILARSAASAACNSAVWRCLCSASACATSRFRLFTSEDSARDASFFNRRAAPCWFLVPTLKLPVFGRQSALMPGSLGLGCLDRVTLDSLGLGCGLGNSGLPLPPGHLGRLSFRGLPLPPGHLGRLSFRGLPLPPGHLGRLSFRGSAPAGPPRPPELPWPPAPAGPPRPPEQQRPPAPAGPPRPPELRRLEHRPPLSLVARPGQRRLLVLLPGHLGGLGFGRRSGLSFGRLTSRPLHVGRRPSRRRLCSRWTASAAAWATAACASAASRFAFSASAAARASAASRSRCSASACIRAASVLSLSDSASTAARNSAACFSRCSASAAARASAAFRFILSVSISARASAASRWRRSDSAFTCSASAAARAASARSLSASASAASRLWRSCSAKSGLHRPGVRNVPRQRPHVRSGGARLRPPGDPAREPQRRRVPPVRPVRSRSRPGPQPPRR